MAPRRHFANLVITVLAGSISTRRKGFNSFHRQWRFFSQQVHQAGTRAVRRHYDSLNIFAARGCPEEVKGLLNFQCQNVGRCAGSVALFIGDARQRSPLFKRSASSS